jgi:hypothetical protein
VDDTVYIAGDGSFLRRIGSFNVYSSSRPCYWQNSIKVDLPVPNEAIFSRVSSIYIKGNMVYTAGGYTMPTYYFRERNENANINFAKYNALVNYTKNSYDYIYPIASIDTGVSMPCYWRETERIDLPVPYRSGGDVNDIIVVNESVYTAGYYFNDMDNIRLPCYWKDSDRIDLSVPDGVRLSSADAINVYNGVVYITGIFREGNIWKLCYWQGSDRIDLPTPNFNLSDIFYFSSDILVESGLVHIVFSNQSTVIYYINNEIIYHNWVGAYQYINGVSIIK